MSKLSERVASKLQTAPLSHNWRGHSEALHFNKGFAPDAKTNARRSSNRTSQMLHMVRNQSKQASCIAAWSVQREQVTCHRIRCRSESWSERFCRKFSEKSKSSKATIIFLPLFFSFFRFPNVGINIVLPGDPSASLGWWIRRPTRSQSAATFSRWRIRSKVRSPWRKETVWTSRSKPSSLHRS